MHILALLASFAGSAYAFADTAPLFASPAISNDQFQYITESQNVSEALKNYSAKFCSNNDQKLVIYRIAGYDASSIDTLAKDSTYIRHVHYKSGSELDLELDSTCKVKYVDEVPASVADYEANVIVVDLDDRSDYSLSQFLELDNVVVQVKPKFSTGHSHVDSIQEFLDESLGIDLGKLGKRSGDLEEDDDEVADDLDNYEEEYRVAEALLVANEDEIDFTDEKHISKNYNNKKDKKKTNSNLFTEYQFFTPGVWLSIIVSLFLIYVATTAISWITSIELSYKSFEKQVDYEKKTE